MNKSKLKPQLNIYIKKNNHKLKPQIFILYDAGNVKICHESEKK